MLRNREEENNQRKLLNEEQNKKCKNRRKKLTCVPRFSEQSLVQNNWIKQTSTINNKQSMEDSSPVIKEEKDFQVSSSVIVIDSENQTWRFCLVEKKKYRVWVTIDRTKIDFWKWVEEALVNHGYKRINGHFYTIKKKDKDPRPYCPKMYTISQLPECYDKFASMSNLFLKTDCFLIFDRWTTHKKLSQTIHFHSLKKTKKKKENGNDELETSFI